MVHETEEWYKLDGSDESHCFSVTGGKEAHLTLTSLIVIIHQ